MPKYHVSPSAQQDLADIFDYIARDKPIAASRWIETLEQRCELLVTSPALGELRPEFAVDIRSSAVGRYVVFYRPTNDTIEVVRIITGDRDVRSL